MKQIIFKSFFLLLVPLHCFSAESNHFDHDNPPQFNRQLALLSAIGKFKNESPLYQAVKNGKTKRVNSICNNYELFGNGEQLNPEERKVLLERVILTGNPHLLSPLFRIGIIHPRNISDEILQYAQERVSTSKSNKKILNDIQTRKNVWLSEQRARQQRFQALLSKAAEDRNNEIIKEEQLRKAQQRFEGLKKEQSAANRASLKRKREEKEEEEGEEEETHQKKYGRFEQSACCICFEPFSQKEKRIRKKCGHIADKKCLTLWYKSRGEKTCPLCKKDNKGKKQSDNLPPQWDSWLFPIHEARVWMPADTLSYYEDAEEYENSEE